MKTVSLLMALLLSCVASAQPVESEKFWTYLLIVAGNDEDLDSGKEFIENTGISDAGAKALVQYARSARDEVNRMGAANAQALCTGKQALRDREALARRFESDAAQQQALWKGFEQNLVTILSPEDESKVRNWVEHEFNIGFGPHIDIASEIRSGRLNPDQVLARACPSAEEIARMEAAAKRRDQGEPKPSLQQPVVPVPDASKTRRPVSSSSATVARPTEPVPLTTLPKPPGYSQCEAWAINNAGMIVGCCWNGKDITHPIPVRWQQGAAEILNGPLMFEGSVEDDLTVVEGMAVAINDAGEIVGSLVVENRAHEPGMRAAIWGEGYWRNLGLPKDARDMSARGINAKGDVVGTASGHAAVYWRAENSLEVLPNVGAGPCTGIGINNQGQAVGLCNNMSSAHDGSNEVAAVLWQNHTAVALANPCGTGGDLLSYGRTITDSGVIGGMAGNCAVVWHTSTPDQAAVLADRGVINSINKRGEMVGYVGVPDGTSTKNPLLRPARWLNEQATVVDIGPKTSKDGRVRAINDRGVFVGAYTSAAGESLAFVSQ